MSTMLKNDKVYVTKEGLVDLKKELKELIEVKRPKVAERMKTAREMGDISENAEYESARDEQSFIEGRILEIENILKNVTIFKEGTKSDTVRVGSTVTVSGNGGTKSYTIVGSNEANPAEGRISNQSPLGLGFLNKRVGDAVEVMTPKGKINYSIENIS